MYVHDELKETVLLAPRDFGGYEKEWWLLLVGFSDKFYERHITEHHPHDPTNCSFNYFTTLL
jgi:hypothetical protein